jgi:hypothetical protein
MIFFKIFKYYGSLSPLTLRTRAHTHSQVLGADVSSGNNSSIDSTTGLSCLQQIKGKIVVLRWARKLEAKTLQSWWLAVLKRRRAVKAAKMWVDRALSRSWNSWYESHITPSGLCV